MSTSASAKAAAALLAHPSPTFGTASSAESRTRVRTNGVGRVGKWQMDNRMRHLALACLLALPAVALAQPPAAPVPPPGLHRHLTQHYVRWVAYCPTETEEGVETCWVYIVRRRETTDISRLDYNGDGCIGISEFTALGNLWGQCEESTE